MRGVPLVFPGHIETVVQDLHLDGPQKRSARSGYRCAPDEYAGVSTTPQEPPFKFEDEILTLPRSAQRPCGQARAVNHPLSHAPGFGSTVHICPPRQIVPVKERYERILLGRPGAASQ